METIYLQNTKEVRKEKASLEKALNVKIDVKGKQATISGDPLQEYEASIVLEAMSFGFSAKKALQLKNENFVFRKLLIKQFTKRKDLHDVRARLIGTRGKTKRTMEEISGCKIILHDNTLGILGPADKIEEATTALTNLIRGSKQANVYYFLERVNTKRKQDKHDAFVSKKDKKNSNL